MLKQIEMGKRWENLMDDPGGLANENKHIKDALENILLSDLARAYIRGDITLEQLMNSKLLNKIMRSQPTAITGEDGGPLRIEVVDSFAKGNDGNSDNTI